MDTQQDEKQNLSKGGGAPCEPTAIHIKCPTVSVDVLLQLGYFLLEGWGRICTPATVKAFIPQTQKRKEI